MNGKNLQQTRNNCTVRANNLLPSQKLSQEGNWSVVVENKLDSTNNQHCSGIPDSSSVDQRSGICFTNYPIVGSTLLSSNSVSV